MNTLYLTGIGPDKPGIVSAITKVVRDLNGNIVDTSMTILGSQFALLMSITFPASVDEAVVRNRFTQVEDELGFTVFLKPQEDTDKVEFETTNDAEPFMISIAGVDKTGITYEITHILAKFGVNITDLNATQIHGNDDAAVYIMMIECLIGAHVDREIFERELAMMGEQLNVEVTYHPIDAIAL